MQTLGKSPSADECRQQLIAWLKDQTQHYQPILELVEAYAQKKYAPVKDEPALPDSD